MTPCYHERDCENMCNCPAKNCPPRSCESNAACKMKESRQCLMEKITQCEFICIDINLFLDTHPNDHRALADYNCYCEQLRALKDAYIHTYGPLENFGNSISIDECEWLWVTQPWPWSSRKCGMED